MKQPKSFEEGLTRLQELLTALQDESTPLAQSVKLYAEAAGLISYCKQTLDAAKLQINEIDASLLANDLIGQMWASDRSPSALQTAFSSPDGAQYLTWLAEVQNALPGAAANPPTPPPTMPMFKLVMSVLR